MQLRHLKSFTLYKATKTKQSNGAYIDTFVLQSTYPCQIQEIDDGVSASLYGAKIDKMWRISSIKGQLETFLNSKLVPSSDNVSDYFLVNDGKKYKISTIKFHWIDIELVGSFSA